MQATKLKVVTEGYPPFEDFALHSATTWQRARHKLQFHWAAEEEHDARNLARERSPATEAEMAALRSDMERTMASLEACEPRSIIGARKVLEVVADVLLLRQLEPGTDWYEGNVHKLILNVRNALEYLDGAMKVGRHVYDD